jgi:hypothetical protein
LDATTGTTGSTSEAGSPRATRRRRRVLAGIALILACLAILITTVAVWAHQVAFNTERFTALVGTVVDEPAVIDPLSDAIGTQVVSALDVQARIEARLPDAAKSLAAPLTLAFGDALDKRLQVALTDPRIQAALVRTVSFTHERVMNLLRDQSNAVSVVNGYVVVDVFPVVGAALAELQADGLIPADVQLPDLSTPQEPGVLASRLQSALGVTLPPDFGTIQLMPADRLLAAQTIVRASDVLVIVLIVLTILLIALALWLSGNRRRMVVYLGVGTIIAFLIARLSINAITDAAISGIANEGLAGAVRSVVDATFADLRGITTIILVATAIVAIAAYLWGRPAWVTSAAGQVGSTAGRAGSAAVAAGGAGVGAVAAQRPSRASVEDTVRDNRATIERVGIAVIVFIVAWIALGLEIAVIGAALVIGFELLLRAIGPDYGDDGGGGSDAESSPPDLPPA